MEKFYNITDTAKFFIMLLIYAGYMSWWASGISHDIKQNTNVLKSQVLNESKELRERIELATIVRSILKDQIRNQILLNNTVIQHAKCTEIMNSLINRIDRVENGSIR